jgi:hypothetical protein
VQVCGIFCVFLNTPCFEVLLSPLFWRESCFTLFSMLFDWSTFFLCFLSIYLFSITPLSFCNTTRREISLNFGVFIFGGWVACFANSQCRS